MAAMDPLTDKQRDFIMKLFEEREITPALSAYVETHRAQERVFNRREASELIEQLLACPKRAPAVASQTPVVQATRVVPHGTYTVDMGDGSHVTLQLEPASFVKDRTTTTASFLSGADNELSYTGFAFVEQDGRVVVWRKFREGHGRQQAALQLLLTGDVDEAHRRFLDMAEAYALQSGSCMRCGKTLTVPASLHRGLGPVCAGREAATAREIASTPRFVGTPRDEVPAPQTARQDVSSNATTAQRELPF